MQATQIITLIVIGLGMFSVIGFISLLAHYYTLNGIKSKTVGDGQHDLGNGLTLNRPGLTEDRKSVV